MKIVFGGNVSVMEDCRALFEAGDREALFVTGGKEISRTCHRTKTEP